MTILLFFLLKRFAVYDNEEGLCPTTTEDMFCICITFLSIQMKAAISNDDCFHL